MERTWRWFGPSDPVSLGMLRQIGVEGIVTSLYDEPAGKEWSRERVAALKKTIDDSGLRWSVVESLPVAEAIKYGGSGRDVAIDNYIRSLAVLGRLGIRTVCYNFMPVIDWVRTDLHHALPDGSTTLYFDYSKLAYFDMHILGREGAEKDYPEDVLERMEKFASVASDRDRAELVDTIIVKTQGFICGNIAEGDSSPVRHFTELMKPYRGLGREDLLSNLKYFLDAVLPVCREYDVNLCIHPDDPPMQVFGLPRIAGSASDIRKILAAADDVHNGLTFCAGSLSAGVHNDVPAMAEEFAPRTHFVHLRSCNLLPGGDFIEAPHTSGRVDLAELIRIFGRQQRNIPMRIDHGREMLGDSDKGYNPGYSFHGRMLAFAQVDGMMAAACSTND